MADPNLRPLLYRRLRALLPCISGSRMRRFWCGLGRGLLWGGVVLYFAFAFAVLALRYWVLPNVGEFRADIERASSQALGLPVSIGHVDAGWRGLRPELILADVRLSDRQGRPALAFSRIESVLSWWSVPALSLRLHQLEIDEPTLLIRRNPDGSLEVAGIPVDSQGSDSGTLDWVLAQHRIHIKDATLVWEDLQRGAPPLVLEAVNLLLENSGSHHRFGLSALPPSELATRLDVRGDLKGGDPARLEDWSGRLYTEFERTDLAAWRAWVDYPLSLFQGSGALRLWLDLDKGQPVAATADLGLKDLRLQLAENLPEMELQSVAGRFSAESRPGKLRLQGTGVRLETVDGRRPENTDFSFASLAGGFFAEAPHQTFTATSLDLGVLGGLAASLPLAEQWRGWLADYQPQGQLREVSARWSLPGQGPQTYKLQARFDALGMQASGAVPGFSGLSGNIEAGEKGGSVTLRSRQAGLDLPRIFADPAVPLDTLTAQASWKLEGPGLEVSLDNLSFANGDASGSARGTYRYTGSGPGSINLSASVPKADGTAVWRYMPLVVSQDARDWLKSAITAGTASEARLVLRGDLARFPFRDPKEGQFLVTAKINDGSLDYASGWPGIDRIQGSLRFEAARMLIEARSARLLGARLAAVKAEISDLEMPEELLKISGKADGPTAEFLKFIDASPVGEKIDNFTDGMGASGEGHLNLGLDLPLRRLADSRVKGEFDFINNQVIVEPALPPITQVNGRLYFSDRGISIRDIGGQILGGPIRISASNDGDKVLVNAQGTLAVAALRRHLDLPLFDNLSGNAPWRGEIRVRKKATDLLIESDLKGVASSLPEPFNKSATQALALRIERSALAEAPGRKAGSPAPAREQLRFSLGKVLTGQLVTRKGPAGVVVERGAIAVGEPLAVPERGLALSVSQPQLDLDFWRRSLTSAFPATPAAPATTGAGAGESGNIGGPTLSQVSLRAAQLDAGGRRFHDFSLRAAPAGSSWQLDLTSREAAGQINWDGGGQGRVKARLKYLILPEAVPRSEPEVIANDKEELPGLDIVADSFAIGRRRFGRLELQARNEGRLWRLDKVAMSSPEGSINGKGVWRSDPGGAQRTDVEFQLEADDAGKYLDRLGFPGTLKRGSATLAGRLGWNNSPTNLEPASLSGELKLSAERGQFAKVEPGIGKLIGLLSLQSLPRRITLDFRDVFSDGFAFDTIEGSFRVKSGLMQTSDLSIDGPAAKVGIRGDIDLGNETQNLTVRVQPALGSSLALGTAALVNPVAGVAALLAQKMLQNPVDQIFSFEYGVSGSWDDPKVEKLRATAKPVINSPGANADEPVKP